MSPLVLTHAISVLLMTGIPVVLAFYLHRKMRIGWGVWWVGGFTFVVSQVGHIPFNAAVNLLFERGWLPSIPQPWALHFSAWFLGLSAGLWEEWFRWIAYRWWVPKARSWKGGIMLGAGHGGMEAILLGLLSLATLINILLLHGKDLSLFVPAEQLQIARLQLEAYWSMPWYYPLLGPVERLFTIPFHITASVLVLQAFKRGKIRWVWLSVLWHGALNAVVAVYLPAIWREYSWWPLAVEGILGLTAVLNIAILFYLKTEEPAVTPSPSVPPQPVDIMKLAESQPTQEDLDKTRFTE